MHYISYEMSNYLRIQGRKIDLPQAEALLAQNIDLGSLLMALAVDAQLMAIERRPAILRNRGPRERRSLLALFAAHLTPAIIARWREDPMPVLRWLAWVFDPQARPLATAKLDPPDLAEYLCCWPPVYDSPRWQQDDLPAMADKLLTDNFSDWPRPDYVGPLPKDLAWEVDEDETNELSLLVESLPDQMIATADGRPIFSIKNLPVSAVLSVLKHPATDWPCVLPLALNRAKTIFAMEEASDADNAEKLLCEVLPDLPVRWPKTQSLPDLSELYGYIGCDIGNVGPDAVATFLKAWSELPPEYCTQALPLLVAYPVHLDEVLQALPKLKDTPPHAVACHFVDLLRRFSSPALVATLAERLRVADLGRSIEHVGSLMSVLTARDNVDWEAPARAMLHAMHRTPALSDYGTLFPGVGFPEVLAVYEKALPVLKDQAGAWALACFGEPGLQALQVLRALALEPGQAMDMLDELLGKLRYLGAESCCSPAPR